MCEVHTTPFTCLDGTEAEIHRHALELLAAGGLAEIGAIDNGVHDTTFLCVVQIARSALGRCRFCNVSLDHYTCPRCERHVEDTSHSAYYLP